MRYDEFRDELRDALQAEGLFFESVNRPIETIDLCSTDRRWKLFVARSAPQSGLPFHVSAEISFDWDPVNAARAHLRGRPSHRAYRPADTAYQDPDAVDARRSRSPRQSSILFDDSHARPAGLQFLGRLCG